MKSDFVSGGPWGETTSSNQEESELTNSFDDSFIDLSSEQKAADTKSSCDPLPDSAQYLAGLERKLDRIRKKKDQLLKDLKEKRQDEMRRLLDADPAFQLNLADEDLSTASLPENPLIRRLAPHKQALTEEEKVPLIKKDQEVSKVEETEEKLVD